MINFKEAVSQAESHPRLSVGLFLVLVFLILVTQTITSPLIVFALFMGAGFVIMTLLRPIWTVVFLSLYLPFEPFLLKFPPDEIYLLARYFSEGLIYLLALSVLFQVLTRQIRLRQSPMDVPFILFCVVLVSSAIINVVSPSIAILGMRQILRFILLFFIVLWLNPENKLIMQLTRWMLIVVIGQSILGIVQSLIGQEMDLFLLPSEGRAIGGLSFSGTNQFWDPGSRVFATLGRYDRLGNFLYVFLLPAVAMLYEKGIKKGKDLWGWALILGIPTLLLTFSRASWFAFLFGALFIAIWVKRDRRIMTLVATAMIIAIGYVGLSGLNVRFVTESPGQTIVERFYETFSPARFRGEYYGLGRVFWAVQTPLVVVPSSPFFGVGPGQFGGGAVSALRNTRVYDTLGLPFGVFGTEGIIDNNWFSIWGESGTLGLLFYLAMFAALFRYAYRIARKHPDPYTRALALGYCAVLIGVTFNAFTSTLLEIRTLAFYLWVYGAFVVVMGSRGKEQDV